MTTNHLSDELLQIAIAVQNSPGVYALLIGSGVSSAAGIPTGWGVVESLIRKIAVISGEESIDDPARWYKERYDEDPRYDKLLDQLSFTGSSRNALLRGYFEPSEQERENDPEIKTPTKAHRAIAKLVRTGYIKVILTTNFDHLLETAIRDVGITPDVISSNSNLENSRPPHQYDIVIYKLHGDYRDDNFKNTPDELENYHPVWDQLLDRVFDEYGLIVCGWSSEYDTALREAIQRTKTRRHTTFWTSYDAEPSETAKTLIRHSSAQHIGSVSADDFFQNLFDSVDALEKHQNRRNPLTIPVAVERVKKLIQDKERHIDLEDLLATEVERTREIYTGTGYWLNSGITQPSPEQFPRGLKHVFEDIEVPLHMLATLAMYSDPNQIQLVTNAINRWLEEPAAGWETQGLLNLMPGLLLIYAAGIAAIHKERWEYLPAFLLQPRMKREIPGRWITEPTDPLGGAIALNLAVNAKSYETGASYYILQQIHHVLRSVFRALIPSDIAYGHAFDLFHMLLSLIYLHHHDWQETLSPNARLYIPVSESIDWQYLEDFWKRAHIAGKDWGLLKTTLFGGNMDYLLRAFENYQPIIGDFLYKSGHNIDFYKIYKYGATIIPF